MKIKEILDKLDHSNDNHWTTDGLPRLETIRLLAGNPKLSRDDIPNDFTRHAANTAKVEELSNIGKVVDLKSKMEGELFKLHELRKAKDASTIAYAAQSEVVDALTVELDKLESVIGKDDAVSSYLKASLERMAARTAMIGQQVAVNITAAHMRSPIDNRPKRRHQVV